MGKNEPTHRLKVKGIVAKIWANETEDQDVWFNVTVTRLYKDGDKWKDSSSFRRDDLPIVSKITDMAYSWILMQERKREMQEREATNN